jgi:5'-nucleotidase
MDVAPYDERFEKRKDPWGRNYYWAAGQPPPPAPGNETDLSAITRGCVTLTPLDFDMTNRLDLARMQSWKFSLDEVDTHEPSGPGEK